MSDVHLESDWDEFCRLESEIGGSDSTGLRARWVYGQRLLGYESGRGRGGSELARVIRTLVAEFPKLSEAELYNRRQFADEYPGDEEFSNALENYASWHELVSRGLGRRSREPIETPPLPAGQYRCIVIDPPWPMDKILRQVRPNQTQALDYPVMKLDEIAELPIGGLADPAGCHVYLWVTHRFLPDGLGLLENWGAKYQCAMTWVKNVGITPFSWMYSTEHVLFGTVGSLPLLRKGLRLDFDAAVQGHSVKPDAFYERVLAASPEPRLEMFARREREGFLVWGNEVAA